MDKDNYIDVIYGDANKHTQSDYPTKFAKHIVWNYFPHNGKELLDIGCGDGRFTEAFYNQGIKVHGLDGCPNPYLQDFKQHDLSAQPYPHEDNSMDVVFTKSVVEHLHDPKILTDEAFRMLKPGGVMICMTPSWVHHKGEAFYADHTHVTPFTRRSLETLCKLSGFEANCDYFYQLPKVWKYPWLMIGVKFLQLLNIPYRPFYKVGWPIEINKMLQFSKEAMLLCIAKKPL